VLEQRRRATRYASDLGRSASVAGAFHGFSRGGDAGARSDQQRARPEPPPGSMPLDPRSQQRSPRSRQRAPTRLGSVPSARQRAPTGLGSVSLGSAALAAGLSSARDVSARLPGSLARSSRFQHAALRSRRRSARRSASRQRHAQRRGAAGGRRRVARRLRRRGRRLIGGERRVRSTPASRGGEPSTSVERAVVDADRRAEQKVGCAGARGGERERRRARRCRQQRQKRLRAAFFSCNGRKATIQFKQ